MRLAPTRGFLGNLAVSLVAFGTPELRRDASPKRQRPCPKHILQPLLPVSVAGKQDLNCSSDRILQNPADASRQWGQVRLSAKYHVKKNNPLNLIRFLERKG
jgi:hypothetical protein